MDNDYSHKGQNAGNTSSKKSYQQLPHMPLKVLIVSEFVPQQPSPGTSSTEPHRIAIDKSTFNEILEKCNIQLLFKMSNHLGSTPKELTSELRLKDLTSFRPETIVEQIPDLKELLETRNLIASLRNRTVSFQSFEQRLGNLSRGSELVEHIRKAFLKSSDKAVEQTPPPMVPNQSRIETQPAKGEKDELASILDMVETPDASSDQSPRGSSVVDELVSSISHFNKREKSDDVRSLDALIIRLDKILSAQVNEIIHYSPFHRLESSWRGLKFLVDRTDFRKDIQIEIVSAVKSNLLNIFDQQVFKPEYEGLGDYPVSLIIAEYEFDNSPQDIELLQNLSRKAEMLQTPLISSIGSAFLGLESADEFHQLPSLGELLRRPDYIKWNGFRKTEPSRWISLLWNRFLLRLPYCPEENPVKTFNFKEDVLRIDSDYLWGNPVWALGSLLVASFARIGWPTEISGMQTGGVIDDLPVWECQPRGGKKIAIPLELLVSEDTQWELSNGGVAPLTCGINSDSAIFLSAHTVHLPERYSEVTETQKSSLKAQLSYQLLASRLAHYLGIIQGKVVSGNTPEGIKKAFVTALEGFVATPGDTVPPTVDAEIIECEHDPDSDELLLTVRPAQSIMGGHAEVEMRMRLRR